MIKIGPYQLPSALIAAPMAGVTDRPFRMLCRSLGADMAVSEMVISDARFWQTRKSRLRLDHDGEPEPRAVQIAGGDPQMMAQAARMNAGQGAQIIDINMGCPAKKVCNRAAGSALMKDESLVRDILQAVVAAVAIPVTLKMRTGWSPAHRNAPLIARMAEDAGIAALAIHGRTRACGYHGEAEYDTIALIKQQVSIPVFANGDIDSPEKARQVLQHTQADGLLIGRAAQGNPWIFREIKHFLQQGSLLPKPSTREVHQLLRGHLLALHAFYGDHLGVRVARKHVGWYLQSQAEGAAFRHHFNQLTDPLAQLDAIDGFFHTPIHSPFKNNEVDAA